MVDKDKPLTEQSLQEIVNSIKPGLLAEKLHSLYDRGEITVKGWSVPDNAELLQSVFKDEEFVGTIRNCFDQAQGRYFQIKAAYLEFEKRLRTYQEEKRNP